MLQEVSHEADQQLQEDCLAGDPAAWRRLVATHETLLLAHIAQHVPIDREAGDTAEDVLQKVWFALLEHDCRRLRDYDPARGSLATYLKAVASQQAALSRRKRRMQPHVVLALGSLELIDPASELPPLREPTEARNSFFEKN